MQGDQFDAVAAEFCVKFVGSLEALSHAAWPIPKDEYYDGATGIVP
jgi:hypothetical protein